MDLVDISEQAESERPDRRIAPLREGELRSSGSNKEKKSTRSV